MRDDAEPGPIAHAVWTGVKIFTLPLWLPIYFIAAGYRKLEKWLFETAPEQPVEADLIWTPRSDLERRVYAAMILAGEPVTNAELARLMGVSPGECSRRVKELEGFLRKERIGREVRISLPYLN